jgi:hypothetical protein
MKSKLTLFLSLVLIFSSQALSQKKDKYGNYLLKELSEIEALRIFGKPTDALRKVSGNPKLLKESIIQGNKVKTVIFNYGSISCSKSCIND